MIDHMIDHIIIKFYDITITFLLDVSSNEYIGIKDYDFHNKKKTF